MLPADHFHVKSNAENDDETFTPDEVDEILKRLVEEQTEADNRGTDTRKDTIGSDERGRFDVRVWGEGWLLKRK